MKRRQPSALRQLFGSYFHEDWAVEFESADVALAAFLKGASATTQARAKKDLAKLLASELDEAELKQRLEKFGCAFDPKRQYGTARKWLERVAQRLAEAC